MSTFRVGDKVKYVGNPYHTIPPGPQPNTAGIVCGVDEDCIRVKTEFYYFTCLDINLELIQDEKVVEERINSLTKNYREQDNTYNHYKYSYKGIKLDPYRILSVYGITCPAQQHAIKKLLRAGNSVKKLKQDIQEVIDALQRKLEMLKEDEENSTNDEHGDSCQ